MWKEIISCISCSMFPTHHGDALCTYPSQRGGCGWGVQRVWNLIFHLLLHFYSPFYIVLSCSTATSVSKEWNPPVLWQSSPHPALGRREAQAWSLGWHLPSGEQNGVFRRVDLCSPVMPIRETRRSQRRSWRFTEKVLVPHSMSKHQPPGTPIHQNTQVISEDQASARRSQV